MDPVAQVLAQQQSGSAEGQGFGQFYAEGKRLAQQQQNLNLSSQRLRLEQQQETRLQKESDLLTPIRAELAKNQSVNLGIEAELGRQKVNQITELNSALPEIYQLQTAFARSPDGFADTNLISKAESLANRFPKAFAPGMPGGELLLNMQSVPMRRQMFNQIKDMNKQLEGTGLKLQQLNPKTGNMEFMRDQTGAQPGQLSPVGKLITDMQAAQAKGDTESAATLKAAIEGQLQKEGFSITLPDGTQISQGGKQPAQTQIKAEDTANNAVNIVELGNEIAKMASGGNTGVQGNLQRLAVQLGGQIGLPVKAGEEFDFQSATGFYKAALTKLLKSDSNISEKEREAIVNSLPNSSVNESAESAQRKVAYITLKAAESARRQIQRAGRPIPAQLMTPAEIDAALRSNKISAREAVEARQVTPFPRE